MFFAVLMIVLSPFLLLNAWVTAPLETTLLILTIFAIYKIWTKPSK